jgi:hypothetical protein
VPSERAFAAAVRCAGYRPLVPDLAADLNTPLSRQKRSHSMLLDVVTHTAARFPGQLERFEITTIDCMQATQSCGAGAAINRRWRKLDSGEVIFQILLKSLADLRGKTLAGLPIQDQIDEVVDALLRCRTQTVHEPLALCGHGEPGQDWGSVIWATLQVRRLPS